MRAPPPFRIRTRCYCQWCAERAEKKKMYKLRDGPIDWYFCNDEHALQWLDNRHRTPAINRMLRRTPLMRDLKGQTIDEFVSNELSQRGV